MLALALVLVLVSSSPWLLKIDGHDGSERISAARVLSSPRLLLCPLNNTEQKLVRSPSPRLSTSQYASSQISPQIQARVYGVQTPTYQGTSLDRFLLFAERDPLTLRVS